MVLHKDQEFLIFLYRWIPLGMNVYCISLMFSPFLKLWFSDVGCTKAVSDKFISAAIFCSLSSLISCKMYNYTMKTKIQKHSTKFVIKATSTPRSQMACTYKIAIPPKNKACCMTGPDIYFPLFKLSYIWRVLRKWRFVQTKLLKVAQIQIMRFDMCAVWNRNWRNIDCLLPNTLIRYWWGCF